MTPRKTTKARKRFTAAEVAPIIAEPEQIGVPHHEPPVTIIADVDMFIPQWRIDKLEEAFANGTAQGPDDRFWYRLDDLPEAVRLFLKRDSQLYVRIGEARGNKGQFDLEWKGVTTLRPTRYN